MLYVAATRARDLLVVPVVGDERRDGWLAALDPALHPEPDARAPPESRAAAGLPAVRRRQRARCRRTTCSARWSSVTPGLHAPEAGEHRVVWWDPAALELGVRESVGLSQTQASSRPTRTARARRGGVGARAGVEREHA